MTLKVKEGPNSDLFLSISSVEAKQWISVLEQRSV